MLDVAAAGMGAACSQGAKRACCLAACCRLWRCQCLRTAIQCAFRPLSASCGCTHTRMLCLVVAGAEKHSHLLGGKHAQDRAASLITQAEHQPLAQVRQGAQVRTHCLGTCLSTLDPRHGICARALMQLQLPLPRRVVRRTGLGIEVVRALAAAARLPGAVVAAGWMAADGDNVATRVRDVCVAWLVMSTRVSHAYAPAQVVGAHHPASSAPTSCKAHTMIPGRWG